MNIINDARSAGRITNKSYESFNMFGPHSVHLLISEYMDGESQCALAADWNLPTTFEKEIFVHPLNAIDGLSSAVFPPATKMTKFYFDGEIVHAMIVSRKSILFINYVYGKIHDNNLPIQYDSYIAYYNIDNGKYQAVNCISK